MLYNILPVSHKVRLTSKTVAVLPSLIFPSHLFFYLPRIKLPDFPFMSSRASLPFLSCCHWTTHDALQFSCIQCLFPDKEVVLRATSSAPTPVYWPRPFSVLTCMEYSVLGALQIPPPQIRAPPTSPYCHFMHYSYLRVFNSGPCPREWPADRPLK